MVAAGLVEAFPDGQQGQKVRGRGVEGGVNAVGLGRLLGRPLARVLDAQGGGDHGDVRLAALLMGRDQHPRQSRIERHPGHHPPGLRQPHPSLPSPLPPSALLSFPFPLPPSTFRLPPSPFLNGPQLGEQAEAVADALRLRPVDEREIGHVPEAERDHAQDDLGQIGAQDLGGGVLRPRQVVLLRVQTDADPVLHAAAAALALVGTAARDRRHRQRGGPRARGVARDPGQAGVHHVADAGNRDGRLGHVGRYDDLAAAGGLEHARLVGGGQAREERQDDRVAADPALQGLAGIADILLGRHEDEHIAPAAFARDLCDRLNGKLHVADLAVVPGRPPPDPCSEPPPGRSGRSRRSPARRRRPGKTFRCRWWPR